MNPRERMEVLAAGLEVDARRLLQAANANSAEIQLARDVLQAVEEYKQAKLKEGRDLAGPLT